MIKFSFVIPCYCSENTIEKVIEEIEETMTKRDGFEYEIITVNDHSPDGVFSVLKRLAAENDRLTVIDLSKNMGKHSALMAGYSMATGDYIVTLDDDGQCPAYELWKLYDALGTDNDIAMAKYPVKKQSGLKNLGSRINGIMSKVLIGRPDNIYFENFGISRRYIIDECLKYKNPYPYMEGLLLRATNRMVNVEMEERDRFAGDGHFTFVRSLKLWINGFTAFSVIPLRAATVMGIITAMLGFIYGIIIIIRKLLNPDMLMGYSSTMSVVLFIGGMIMMMLGLIGEYVGRIYICINNSPQYVIREVIHKGGDKEKEKE